MYCKTAKQNQHIANCAAWPEIIGAHPVSGFAGTSVKNAYIFTHTGFIRSFKVLNLIYWNLKNPACISGSSSHCSHDILNHKHINYLCHKMTRVFSERLNLVWKVLTTRKLISNFFPTSYGTCIQHVSRLTVTSAATPSVSLQHRKQEVCVVWR